MYNVSKNLCIARRRLFSPLLTHSLTLWLIATRWRKRHNMEQLVPGFFFGRKTLITVIRDWKEKRHVLLRTCTGNELIFHNFLPLIWVSKEESSVVDNGEEVEVIEKETDQCLFFVDRSIMQKGKWKKGPGSGSNHFPEWVDTHTWKQYRLEMYTHSPSNYDELD